MSLGGRTLPVPKTSLYRFNPLVVKAALNILIRTLLIPRRKFLLTLIARRFISFAGGYIVEPNATSDCLYCAVSFHPSL